MSVAKGDSQKLGRGDDAKFGQVVTCYERKEYKKGHRLAEEILKRYPDHGETQAMKGLLYNCQGDRKTAYEWVKLGLKNNIRSHICWHVYGLIYRSDRNYKEATKCYMNALRLNKHNQNILRDLGYLQLQTRNYDAYCVTRREMLRTKPNVRSHWVAMAMAHYTNKEYDVAFDVITKGNEISQDGGTTEYEIGEMLALQVECLSKQGKYEDALEHIKKIESQVVDKLFIQQKRAEFLTLCGESRKEEARKAWLDLLEDEPENYQYHSGLQCVVLGLEPDVCLKMFPLKCLNLPSTELQLTEEQRQLLLNMYEKETGLSEDKYGALVVRKIKFSLLEGTALCQEMEAHIKQCLSKGLPALYADVCNAVRVADPAHNGRKVVVRNWAVFREHSLVKALQDFLRLQIDNLQKVNTFVDEETVQPPTTLLWALFLKAHLHQASGEMEQALAYINECITHTPTATDLYLKKAQILKHMGALNAAAETADVGRALDLQDRYLNNKATKYFLRADVPKAAADNMSLFARYEGDPQQYLHEMQTSWFELEAAEAWQRMKQFGQSLKKFHSVKQHFVDYGEDMFDFHSFSVRKSTLRAHSDALSMQDTIFGHHYFQRATEGALTVYCHLIDDPEDVDGLAHLPTKDRKKERERRKKQKSRDAKAEEERTQKALEEAEWMGAPKPQPGPKDADPYGDTYLSASFSDEAYSWAQLLAPHYHLCSERVLALIVDVMVRRSKPAIALKVLAVGKRKFPQSPFLATALLKFAHRLCAPTTKSTKAMSKNSTVLDYCRNQVCDMITGMTAGAGAGAGAGAVEPPLSRAKISEWVQGVVAALPSSAAPGTTWSGLHGRLQLAKAVILCVGEKEGGGGLVTTQVLPQLVVQSLLENPNNPTLGAAYPADSKACNADPRVSAAVLTELGEPRGVFKQCFDSEYTSELRQSIVGLYPTATGGSLQGAGAGAGGERVGVEDLDEMPGLEKV